MKEELYKNLTISFLLSICFATSLDSYDFVYHDTTPITISKNNFGIRSTEINNKWRLFLHSQNWIAENLYFSGSISPSTNNTVNFIYNMNLGYQTSLSKDKFKNLYFDFGYYYKRFEKSYMDNQKWTTLSMIFGIKLKKSWLLPSFMYLYEKNEDDNKYESLICIDYLKELNKNFYLKLGVQFYENGYSKDDFFVKPNITIKYKI